MYCFKCENSIKSGTLCEKCGYDNAKTGSFVFPVTAGLKKPKKEATAIKTKSSTEPAGRDVDLQAKSLKASANELDTRITELKKQLDTLKNENAILLRQTKEQQKQIDDLNGQKQFIKNMIEEVMR